MRNAFLVLTILAFSLIYGCRPGGEDFIISIPAEFSILAREALGPAPRQHEIVIFGLQKQPCSGTGLEQHWTIDQQGGHLNIQGYIQPQPCTGPSAHVMTRLPLSWKEAGEYPLTINLRNSLFNPGILQINPSGLWLKMYSQHGITVPSYQVERLPDGIFWGYLTSDDPDQLADIEAFLAQWPGESPLHVTGEFGHFSVTPAGDVTMGPVQQEFLTHYVSFLRKGIDKIAFTSAMQDFLQNNSGMVGYLASPEGLLIQ